MAPLDPHAQIDLLRAAIAHRPDAAHLRFQLADLLARSGDAEAYAATFRDAFRLAPSVQPRLSTDAARPLADRADQLRNDAVSLIACGIAYAPVIAALAIAESLLGNAEIVRWLIDYQRLFRCAAIHPTGPDSDAAFRAELACELTTNARYRAPQNGRAGGGRYRFDVLDTALGARGLLAHELDLQVERYIAALPPDSSHPFVASRPARYVLKGWSVASSRDDHFAPHVHPQAWISGVYYVACPETARENEAGALRVAPPAQFGVSESHGWAERTIAPLPGRLVLMPGYFYHETLPTLSSETRLCVAFNVVPEELDSAPQGYSAP
jgi:hypothetical protein